MNDVAIIGGGVVGCAIARKFSLAGAQVLLLERGPDILSGASKGNSGLLHTGYDALENSLELACVQAGHQEYLEIHRQMNLPLLETDAMVVAWSEEDEQKFEGIEGRAGRNGVRLTPLSGREVLAREPHLNESARRGLLVPGEHVIDPWSAPLAYLRQAMSAGARVSFNTEVLGGTWTGDGWALQTSKGIQAAKFAINAAGLFGDLVDLRVFGESKFTIKPRKGQFVVFDKAASRLLKTTILPVPTEKTKGVVLARTIFGNVLVGPTAEEQSDRERATVTQNALTDLISAAVRILPGLRNVPVTATYAGLRPATEQKDYAVWNDPSRKWITVGGIRSTGLTSALGLASHVYDLYGSSNRPAMPKLDIPCPQMPSLAEHEPRPWRGDGDVVCHCELVTRAEILSALTTQPEATTVSGLKRRTRAMMGRCQGFYCSAKIAELTKGKFIDALAEDAGDDHR